jgi:extradiol dioxygenase family protein
MRRFHVHVSVDDLAQSTTFYTHLFGEPARTEPDYVKWLVEDPPLHFAISQRGSAVGINHLGIQVESEVDLRSLRGQLQSADARLHSEDNTSCCYARSDKYWVTDPQGIAWETFHSLASIPTFGGKENAMPDAGATRLPPSADGASCCTPIREGDPVRTASRACSA